MTGDVVQGGFVRTQMSSRGGSWDAPLICGEWGAHGKRASPHASARLTQRLECGAHLGAKRRRLLPGGEVTALVEPVVVNELGIGLFRPAARCLIQLVRIGANGDRKGDALRGEKGELALPIETSRGDGGVRQPIECDVVDDVLARKAFGLAVK